MIKITKNTFDLEKEFIKIKDSMLAKKPIKTIKLALLLPKTSQTMSVIRNVNG